MRCVPSQMTAEVVYIPAPNDPACEEAKAKAFQMG